MSKPLPRLYFLTLMALLLCAETSAQEFRWPREQAFEVGAGASATGAQVQAGYIHYFQPKKISEIPFKKRYHSLTGRNKYVAFPCKPKPSYKVPPGLFMKASLFYEVGSTSAIPYQIVGVDVALLYMIYHTRNLYISMKGGVTASHNRLLKRYELDYYNRFKYGAVGGFEIERMLDRHKNKSIAGGWGQCRLVKGDSWGSTRWSAFVALRFKITTVPKV